MSIFRKQADSFAELFGYRISFLGLSADGKADQLLVSYVTGNYFSVLGVKPLLGRLILGGEENQRANNPSWCSGTLTGRKDSPAIPT